MAILNRFFAMLLSCNSTHFLLLAAEFLAIPGPRFWEVQFAIRDSVPLSESGLQTVPKSGIRNSKWKCNYVTYIVLMKTQRQANGTHVIVHAGNCWQVFAVFCCFFAVFRC